MENPLYTRNDFVRLNFTNEFTGKKHAMIIFELAATKINYILLFSSELFLRMYFSVPSEEYFHDC